MRKIIRVFIALCLLLGGLGGLLLPVFGYIYARDWTKALMAFCFPLYPFFFLPALAWGLFTGVGLLARRKWAWYSVQALCLFLLLTGFLLLFGFNLLFHTAGQGASVDRLRLIGNLGAGLIFVLLPIGGLVFFARSREEYETNQVLGRTGNPPTFAEDRWPYRQL